MNDNQNHRRAVSMTKYSDLLIHPAAVIFPLLDGVEFDELVDDIRANGLNHPVVFTEENELLDGRNRYRACEVAGVEPEHLTYEGSDPIGFVVSENIRRRHLDETQRGLVASRAETLRQGVGRASSKDAHGHLSRQEASDLLNVSPRTIARAAEAERKGTPELVGAMERGEISARPAAEIARQFPASEDPEKQREALTAHVSNNSGNNEWYTPVEYIQSAREVMGGIDLDPASCEAANGVVQASRFYTAEDDGLAQRWKGRVWLNPPYAQPLIAQFCDKVAQQEYDEACILVNNATETKWAQTLFSVASAVCFVAGRIRFWQPGSGLGAPLQGQMVVYVGDNAEAFDDAFSGHGTVFR